MFCLKVGKGCYEGGCIVGMEFVKDYLWVEIKFEGLNEIFILRLVRYYWEILNRKVSVLKNYFSCYVENRRRRGMVRVNIGE